MNNSLFVRPNFGMPLNYQIIPKHKHSRSGYYSINCTNSTESKPIPTLHSKPISTVDSNQHLNLSVLRFTLGIPGLDESYLPRWIGYAFGSLLVLNHFYGSGTLPPTSAQLRTEALGLSLAGFSVALPYLGQFLKGATPVNQEITPVSAEQIFVMSLDITDNAKDDLAWVTYVLLRNTNSISVLIVIEDALCVRGYWNTPGDVSKEDALYWFKMQVLRIGLSDIKNVLYFPQSEDSKLWKMLPKGACSLLLQPLESVKGFVLLASNIKYAYTDKDRAWIAAIANKFRGKQIVL